MEKSKLNEWWDINGNYKILHKINPLRLDFIINNFNKPLNNKKVLDIGCGGGLISELLSKKKANVTGIDENIYNIKQAKNHAKISSLKINYLNKSLNSFNKKNKQKYDLILCLEVLEHVENVEESLEIISKLLKTNGTLILSTINRNLKSLIFAKMFGEYILNWIPIGTHQYKKFLKPEEIIQIFKLKKINFKKIKGMEFNPVLNKWFLSNNTNINYFMVGKK
ncbi:MAG: Ubiquinone biosynthesis O-methyltransferase [Alphaproteobacteria bacterium MarineAlpha6_Bin6]|nr:bifunctional 3-demethylubiquinol 3-O-methyltransferase/2-polyprenyl-6-hydroxyphenol methylase [Pelagibacteraceae bacterium]PPR31051.1 MAG: Ubiquinone biosynthesis O-methyltransferase [Alphaproteobacteria bacterium MarineAlpha6_Bin6]PPR32837.1 MAG: Ubiquinone biosynthesis O-methyltransferase [Alphaproteobacteria bacterium MarineAlpha6_Bin5]|tara:strand:- start:7949 stop:8617 length:669 start_codon:yes stop_codon:yes gene_type:complete